MLDTTIPRAGTGAIEVDGKFAAEIATDGKSAVDDENWFSEAAREFYPLKAGDCLHYLTGFDLRLCQRYAPIEGKPTKPSAYFLRRLLRGDHGEQWLNIVMSGAGAQWWLDLQRAKRVAEAIKNIE